MTITLTIISAYFAACTASFVLAAAERTLKEKKWWGAERSACAACGKTLAVYELLPLFSYIVLKGKCSYCGAKIPVQCLIVELIGVFCGAFFAFRFCFTPALLICHTAFLFLLFSAYTDLKSGYVYDSWALASAVCGLAVRGIFCGNTAFWDGIYGVLVGGVLMLVIYLASQKKGMGLGDVYFIIGFGALLGLKMTILGLYCAFLGGGCFAMVLLLMKQATRKTALPLVPFLAAGALFSLIIYPAVFTWFGITADVPF